ncbi:hypothetical protein ACZ87_01205 [Candidatus Erwinia dacicola]|uniref:Uncharacterized protein n=1 Tax=Candidatus Erwinia dacicola TaxID=252393 RepID=A0A328TR05_9GAMM|nr:hypothetical protein ACZ87_01205 [Candidatus Erwinia dacicola]
MKSELREIWLSGGQDSANIIRIFTRTFIVQILKDRCRHDLQTGLEQGKDIAQLDIFKRVLACPPVLIA